ncbi:3'-5' exonuclease [Marinibactrum halimedae]|uniref:DNA polymerase III subunit epsilon n=1 Tax=Marinibactrum halimedae TaxID=1444977 RepID=A0AA37WLY5_9GAMM|nr:3'-5' exonuclease [Marinibactrum halimedae]MCD9460661.1 3'-5' exonuclease [Marinibactrum halimedae]GLS24306.1 DNA polymerase III subunit epsilon [Marinibactrum halimedae]
MLSFQRMIARWRAHSNHTPLSPTLINCWHDSPKLKKALWKQFDFLVVDTETSSLHPQDGELLSIGWVVIRQGSIQLNSSRHLMIRPSQSVGDSATIHQLRDCELNEGITEAEMMTQLIDAAQGKILVFHHASLDLRFLNAACQRCLGGPLLLPTLDTLQIEKQRLERRNQPIVQNALRLGSCRARYNLPIYPAHNALVDALATAELLIAQFSHQWTKEDKK